MTSNPKSSWQQDLDNVVDGSKDITVSNTDWVRCSSGEKKTDFVTYRTDHENEFSKILTKYIKKNTRFWLAEKERILM